MSLSGLSLAELQARVAFLADTCQEAAGRGDDVVDDAAFEELLPLLAELEDRELELRFGGDSAIV